MSSATDKRKSRPYSRHQSNGSGEDVVFEKIESFIKRDQDSELDIQDVVSFFSSGFGAQAIQKWSFYSQSSDSGKFTVSTINLTKFLKVLTAHQETIEHAVQIIKELLTSYQKTLYRALSAQKASVTNPALRLINEIIILKDGALLDDFFALFDFTLAALPKLLQPSKYDLNDVEKCKEKEHLSVRYCFIRVLLNLLKYSPPLLRKDFIANNTKLISVWFKHFAVIDSDDLIAHTLAIWDEKILKEQSFKKLTKLKFFNEWNLTKLTPLYYNLKNEETKSNFNKFIISLATDFKYGLRFPQDDSWFIRQAPSTASLSVNQKQFKLNNKLLYNLVSNLKPWDDDTQLRTSVEIMQETPELVAPFTNYLASRGLHDPKLTSYWIGQTLLLSKIIRSDIPREIEEYSGAGVPSKYTIGELIVPSVLNRSVLVKCLQADSFLIRQLSVQLIVDSLQKLETFIVLYETKNWLDSKVELVNHIYNMLPDLASLTACLTDSYTKKSDNKILLATLLMALNGYSIFNDSHNYSQAISKPFLDVINNKSFTSLDLVLLDNFFKLQEGDTTQLKWWNKTDGSSSLFTSLVKLASLTESVRAKITSLLSSLIKQTVVFNYDIVKEDQITILVRSLAAIMNGKNPEDEELTKVWKLLDESISRSVRTPFKYLDQSNANERISPLILTIFEQWKFVEKSTSYKLASKWLVLFSRYLIIIGEPAETILKLLKDSELDFEYDNYVFEGSYEPSISVLSEDVSLKEFSKTYFFEFITTSSFKDVLQSNSIPLSDIDIVGALSRISSITQDSTLTLEDSKDILSLILSRVGNFWFTHPESVKKFSELKYWESLYLQSSEEKSIYVSNVLVEIFSQLDAFDSAQFSKVVVSQLSKQLSEDEQIILGESLWSLNNEELRTSLETDSTIIKLVGLKLLLERRLSLHSDTLSKLLNFASLVPVLNEFIVQDLVVFNDFSSFFKSIINIEGTLPVFKSLSQHEEALTELVEFALAKNDPIFIAYIASSLNESSIKDLEGSESLSSLLDQAKSKALELIQNEEFEDVSFNQLLNIFTFQHTSVSEDEKHRLIEYSLTKVSNKYTSEISNLVKAFGLYESSLIRTWINKSVLYLTKIYAEYTVFPASFLGFVESFKDLLLNIKISKFLNKLNINALLEVVFTKWIKDEKSLELASVIIVTGSKSIFEYKKLLQILINNEDISLLRSGPSKVKFYSALLISKLFDFDVSRNSNKAIQDKILSFYGGSTKPEDLVLFSVLEKLESKLNASWIDQVYNWEFFDLLNEGEEELIGEIKLIEKKKEGFLVTLNKKYIQNGLNNYIVVRHKLPILKSSDRENWAQLQNFYESVVIDSPENPSDTKYDPLFLSLMIINNDELIEITSDEDSPDLLVKSNMKKLIESELFSSIITNLASSDDSVQMVTKNILGSLLNSLKDEKTSPTFRDRHIFELFITKILFTFTQPDYTKEQFSPLIFIFITSLIPVLTNPGHILFEKAYRWILKSPSIRPNEIPLFQEITTISGSGEDSEVYYRELTWLLNNFVKGVQNKEDVQLLRNKNIFEWLLNLQNSPYVNTRIKYLIIELIYVLQNVEEGADILVARFGGLSSIEQRISAIIGDLQGKKGVDELQKEQELLNLRQVALKFGIIGQSKKRIVDWTNDDIGGFIKRVTKDSV